jgi:predicted ATPase/class 3 adenylate cyclase
MPDLPTGTVTFLFTDIEGSTRMLQELGGAAYGGIQDQHAAIMRTAVELGDGVEIRTEGDSFFVAFPTPTGALQAAVAAQRELASFPWTNDGPVRVRMGLHTGDGILGGDDYLGIDVNRAARIAAAGHGGQVLLSEATKALVEGTLPDGVVIRDLGLHRLKDIERPEHLHDVVIDGLPAAFPPLRSLDVRKTNLPPLRTSFVGRARESAEIAELLRTTRLLTLTGPGGTGKTRLALKAAAEQLGRFIDGAYFVDLSAVTESAFVVPEIAGVLGVRQTPGRELTEALHDRVRERTLLLVLDNLEQLVEASFIVGDLLDAAEGVTVLATSRIALRLSGEQEYRVEPLALPDQSQRTAADRLSECESVRLFLERAAAVQPGFRITDRWAPAIAEIVVRLDGLPLALELAASRLRLLNPVALAQRLERRLPLLTGGPRDAPERQRTLEGAIRWSHEILEADEQRLFARLSIFAGGWTVEAAEAVCGTDLDVLTCLGTLVDDSLVRRTELLDGELRFGMLETIREYAADRLAASDPDDDRAVRRRHAAFFRDLAEQAEPHLTGEEQTRWLTILEREHDNVRTALDLAERAQDPDDVATGLRTAAAIWRFWQQRGHLPEGRARLERLLVLPAAQRRDAVRARASGALGSIAYWLADHGAVQAGYEEAVGIAREIGEPRLLSQALFDLSFVPILRKDLDASEAILREGLAVSDGSDPSIEAQIWTGLGFVKLFRGDLPGALEPIERSIELHRALGARMAVCESLVALVGLEMSSGNPEAARARLNEAIGIVADSNSPFVVATVVIPCALLANIEDRHRRAARLVGAWERLVEDFEVHFPEIGLNHYGDPAGDARAALGDEAFESARAEGFAMSVDQIIELVTADIDPAG